MADTELYSINTFPGNGSQTNFEISFAGGYISKEHVKAYYRVGIGNSIPVPIEWVGNNVVRVSPAIPTGATLTVYRDTPKDVPLADFSDGAVLTEESLDINAKQAVFIAAEAQDNGSERLDNLDRTNIRAPLGGEIQTGFVVVDDNGRASGQNFLNVIRTATPIYDDGAWGGSITSDGVWG